MPFSDPNLSPSPQSPGVQVPDIRGADAMAAGLLIECRGRDEAALQVPGLGLGLGFGLGF
jgi:hypothetical protein